MLKITSFDAFDSRMRYNGYISLALKFFFKTRWIVWEVSEFWRFIAVLQVTCLNVCLFTHSNDVKSKIISTIKTRKFGQLSICTIRWKKEKKVVVKTCYFLIFDCLGWHLCCIAYTTNIHFMRYSKMISFTLTNCKL